MTTAAETTDAPTRPEPFSAQVRAATWTDHRDAEQSTYMTALLTGELDRRAYAALVAQHWFAYEVLERAADAQRDHPVAGQFVFEELRRLPSIEHDLVALVGEGWRDEVAPVPATQAYCERMEEVCFASPGGFVAHHYTRYLGDLSGGLMIGRVVDRRLGLAGEGVAFYRFDRIDDPETFKDRYRAHLDLAPWTPAQQAEVIDEIRVAYALNSAVFADLDTLIAT